MAENVMKRNLEYLDKKYPGMKKLIEKKYEELIKKENISLRADVSYGGESIIVVSKDGKDRYLSGRRKPEQSAKNQISVMGKLYRGTLLFMVGLGNIHYLDEAVKATDPSSVIVVYEPSFTIFYHQLGLVDFKSIIGDRIVAIVVKDLNDDGIDSLINKTITFDRLRNIRTFVCGNYQELYAEDALEFVKKVSKRSVDMMTDINTTKRFSMVSGTNTYLNARYLKTGYEAKSLFKKIPFTTTGIVVSAGPSLNKNINELKKAKGKAFIVAVDTAVKPLMKAGIVPDMFAIVDGVKPVDLVTYPGAEEIPMLTLPGVSPDVLSYNKGKKFFVSNNNPFFDKIMGINNKFLDVIPVGGSVATLAMGFLEMLGLNSIILVGQDLALTGNKSHADGTFKEKMDEVDTSAYEMVPGNVEEMVPTRPDFKGYLMWFEENIKNWKKRYPDFKVYNATEGGAKMEGTEIVTLKEAIDLLCTEDIDIAKIMEEVDPIFDEDMQKKVEEYFENVPKELHKLVVEAKKGSNLYKKLDTICNSNSNDEEGFLKVLKKIKNNVKQLEKNPHYEIIQDTLAEAEDIIKREQYANFDDANEERKEIARKGKIYTDLVIQCSEMFEEITNRIYVLKNWEED